MVQYLSINRFLGSNYISGKNVVYCASIHSDYPYILDRVKRVHELGGNGVHVNFWCGLGVYKAIRELDLPIFLHFQKSGDKILTNKMDTNQNTDPDFYIKKIKDENQREYNVFFVNKDIPLTDEILQEMAKYEIVEFCIILKRIFRFINIHF